MNFSSPFSTEIVTPFLISLGERFQAHTAHTIHMIKGCGKIHLFLVPILSDRAGEKGVDTGIGLIKKRNEIIFEGNFVLCVQSKLAVHGFELVHSKCFTSILQGHDNGFDVRAV